MKRKHPPHLPQSPVRSSPRDGQFARWGASLGPGLISGAADDDPSGIGTYSIAGAQLGTSLLWTALLTWPLMAAVQMMCARIGMVSGRGLAANLRKKLPRSVLITTCVALFAANTLNVGADLSAMADAATMLTGLSTPLFILIFSVGITVATVMPSYRRIASTLKWLALFLFAYVATAYFASPDWHAVLRDTFVPTLPKGGLATVVAILGTTISPYLFFWQSAEEIEEEKSKGHLTIQERRGSSVAELRARKFDVGIGTFFSNAVMYFIILATALTLNRAGITQISSSTEAAKALEPLAGRWAAALYALGLVGTGLLAIPTLTGSAAYALADTFGWRQGLDNHLKQARAFYAVIVLSTVLAVVFDFAGVNPVKSLYISAIVNGLLAPFLMIGILMVAVDRKLMCGQTSSRLGVAVVSITMILMFAAGVGMFVL